jgi:hypothetical protein
LLSRINGEDDATLFALKMNVLNILNGDLGQQSWHQNSAETRNSPRRQQLVNSSIANRWSDTFHHKRFSLNLEGPSEHYQPFYSEASDMRENSFKRAKQFEQAESAVEHMKKKRRLSNLGYLTASFFDDYAKATRRGSMASVASFAASNQESCRSESDDESVISNVSGEVGFDRAIPSSVQSHEKFIFSEVNMKETMEAFNDSMTNSQKSQQAIHDWDKKMGLKRSHSKTMRLSMRSRKKLKLMIKKDINLLGSVR